MKMLLRGSSHNECTDSAGKNPSSFPESSFCIPNPESPDEPDQIPARRLRGADGIHP